MCGRIVQKSGPLDYVERIFPNPRRVFDEPCVIERDQHMAALLEDPRKLRKGMGPR